jgi:glycosyltransferase involved in cell wall biosynthesis
MMRFDWGNILRRSMEMFFQIFMKIFVKLKPFFAWLDPNARSLIKAVFVRLVFNFLYSSSKSGVDYKFLVQGANLIGYPFADIGEGEFLRQTARSLLKADVDFGVYNYNAGLQLGQDDQRMAPFTLTANPYITNIFHLKPDQAEASILALGESFVAGRYNIGYWLWELSRFPDVWMGPLRFFDEIWCPSRFIQSAVAERSTRPVLYMPPAIEIDKPEGFNRAYFKLPEEQFTFLLVFDFKSYASRKNPLACIRAFQSAFPKENKRVGLVLKSMGGDQYSGEFKCLIEAARNDSRITFIDATYTFQEALGLMNVCDVFVSLHRTEGIGLGIAQSMLLGKPVVVTNYSGNTDFTLPDNSCLVDFKLIPVKKGEYPHGAGQVWADPDIYQAANYMRRLASDKVYREKLTNAGRAYIETYHSAESVGKVYRNRLVELGLWGK